MPESGLDSHHSTAIKLCTYGSAYIVFTNFLYNFQHFKQRLPHLISIKRILIDNKVQTLVECLLQKYCAYMPFFSETKCVYSMLDSVPGDILVFKIVFQHLRMQTLIIINKPTKYIRRRVGHCATYELAVVP